MTRPLANGHDSPLEPSWLNESTLRIWKPQKSSAREYSALFDALLKILFAAALSELILNEH